MAWSPILKKTVTTLPLAPGWTGGTVTLVTTRDGVTVHAESLARAEAGSGWTLLATLPAGARPVTNAYGKTMRGLDIRVTSAGALQVSSPLMSLDYGTLSFHR